MRGISFDVGTYLKAVQSYISGAKKVDEIVKEAGMSERTFYNKLKEYGRNGGRIDLPRRRGSELKRTPEFNKALKKLKREHPNYGAERLRRELEKNGHAVSGSTVSNALAELNLQLPQKRGASTKRRSSGARRTKNR